jgi:hypothetical protein
MREEGLREQWRKCSFLCCKRVPAAVWTMALGRPVVPLE